MLNVNVLKFTMLCISGNRFNEHDAIYFKELLEVSNVNTLLAKTEQIS